MLEMLSTYLEHQPDTLRMLVDEFEKGYNWKVFIMNLAFLVCLTKGSELHMALMESNQITGERDWEYHWHEQSERENSTNKQDVRQRTYNEALIEAHCSKLVLITYFTTSFSSVNFYLSHHSTIAKRRNIPR